MTDLTLYTNPRSRGAIAHWMVEEIGEPHTIEWLDFGAPMKAPAYLAINPMGKVPALRHGAAVVTEAAAICAYLADAFPDRGLMPPPGDPARASYFRWLFFAAGPLEQAVTAKAFGWDAPDKGATLGFGSYTATLDALEGALGQGPWICGERFTAADVYAGSQVVWGLMFGTVEKRPAFEAYVARLVARPARQRMVALNEARVKAAV